MYACIAYTDNEDGHLTNNSMQFHEHMGFRLIGTFKKCGYKFDKWYDMIWMEKFIGEHKVNPDAVTKPEIQFTIFDMCDRLQEQCIKQYIRRFTYGE